MREPLRRVLDLLADGLNGPSLYIPPAMARSNSKFAAGAMRSALLGWYDAHRRVLPWRALPGEKQDPYRVWLSEIMLQQTTVATVAGYFARFLERWPDVRALAAADLDEVLHAWQGLGYYARARNLHKCAVEVASRHGGVFPSDAASLRSLPGIGEYTSAAIAAIAFDRAETVVDGNVERVVARLFGVEEPFPGGKHAVREAAATLTSDHRPGDFAQAMMDLGATVCTPRQPNCLICPLQPICAASAEGAADRYPIKAEKKRKPIRHGDAWWLTRGDGAVLLRRRPERGLLGGMVEVPSDGWSGANDVDAGAVRALGDSWQTLGTGVTHVFTHFQLEMQVHVACIQTTSDGPADGEMDGFWVMPDAFGDHALPTLMKKVVRTALRGG